jgi:hypothetical protein
MKLSVRQAIGPGVVASLVAVLAVGGVACILGARHVAAARTIARVGPDQVAGAMQGDDVYAGYGGGTLVLTGTVAALAADRGQTVVGFRTATASGACCDFGAAAPAIRPGDTIAVVSEGAVARRRTAAVRLEGCALP